MSPGAIRVGRTSGLHGDHDRWRRPIRARNRWHHCHNHRALRLLWLRICLPPSSPSAAANGWCWCSLSDDGTTAKSTARSASSFVGLYGHSYPDKVYYDSGPGAGYYGPGYGPQSFYHQSGRPYQQQQPGGGGSMMGTMGAAAAGAGAGMLAGHVMGNMFGGGNDNDNFGGGGDIAAETGDFGGGGFDDGGGGGDLFAES
ncbi:hypothetical protein NFJ02_25g59240 [Pycnococcus provasolii]